MIKFAKKKVAAIVPALNEEANVAKVLRVLLDSEVLDQVILVDDGSTDKTAEIGERLGAKVIKLPKVGGSGKGNAMKKGLESTSAEIIVFFDADLIGLSKEHIYSLVSPMLTGNIEMCVGIRGRLLGLPNLIAKIDPLLAIGGERAIKRHLLEDISSKFVQGFAVEPTLNYYCMINKLPVRYTTLKKLSVIIKEKKRGFINGFISRIEMIFEIAKTRLLLTSNKNEFI